MKTKLKRSMATVSPAKKSKPKQTKEQIAEFAKIKKQIKITDKNTSFINDSLMLINFIINKNIYFSEKEFKTLIQSYRKKYFTYYGSGYPTYKSYAKIGSNIIYKNSKMLNYLSLFNDQYNKKIDIKEKFKNDILKDINKNIISLFSKNAEKDYLNEYPKEWLGHFSSKNDAKKFISNFNFHNENNFVCEFLAGAFGDNDLLKILIKKDFHPSYKDYIIENNLIKANHLNIKNLTKENLTKIKQKAIAGDYENNIEILLDTKVFQTMTDKQKADFKAKDDDISNYLNSIVSVGTDRYSLLNLFNLYNSKDSVEFLNDLKPETLSMITQILYDKVLFKNKKIINKLFDNEIKNRKNDNGLLWMLRQDPNLESINKKAIELVLSGHSSGIIDYINLNSIRSKPLAMEFAKYLIEYKLKGMKMITNACKKHKFEIKIDAA